MKTCIRTLLCLSVGLSAQIAWAQTQTGFRPPWGGNNLGDVEMYAELNNVFLMRSDTDFDPSKPLWDDDGQTTGVLATIFRPLFTYNISDGLRLHYEAEIGLNFWSRNDPDQEDMTSPSVFVMKHRELWGSGNLDDDVGFRVGYGRFQDPTGLFLDHWIGAAQFWIGGGGEDKLGFYVAQIPDGSHEGIDVTENNFSRDIFTYGARFDWRIVHDMKIEIGLHNLYDSELAGQERWLICPNFHFVAGKPGLQLQLSAVLQVGQAEGQTPDGHIQHIIAWAAEGHFRWGITNRFKLWPSVLDFNVLVLSPDDAHPDNNMQHGFYASGKNHSPTIMLTEDELRDWYDNYDERMSAYRGGFYQNRAGLFLADVKATWHVADWADLYLVLAGAAVLKPANALDEAFAGVEIDLVQEYRVARYAFLRLAVGSLIPGRAAAALVNAIDLGEHDPVWMGEVSVLFRY